MFCILFKFLGNLNIPKTLESKKVYIYIHQYNSEYYRNVIQMALFLFIISTPTANIMFKLSINDKLCATHTNASCNTFMLLLADVSMHLEINHTYTRIHL
jgi:hypothetical protein